MLTKLESVNQILAGIGEYPVNTIEDTAYMTADTIKAIAKIDTVSKQVQAKRWKFNYEENYNFSPNLAGEIELPVNILRIDCLHSIDRYLVQRGLKLYDNYNHTYIINRTVDANILVYLNFEDLPYSAQNYITIRAKREFQEEVLTSETISKLQFNQEEDAWKTLLQEEEITQKFNIFIDNAEIAEDLNWRT
jgi:hypothetical protein